MKTKWVNLLQGTLKNIWYVGGATWVLGTTTAAILLLLIQIFFSEDIDLVSIKKQMA